MIKIFTLLLLLQLTAFAGGMAPVKEEDLKKEIEKSVHAFEASFVRYEENYALYGKLMKGEQLEEFKKLYTNRTDPSIVFWDKEGLKKVDPEKDKGINTLELKVALKNGKHKFNIKGINIVRTVFLKITKPIKGKYEKGKVYPFTFWDADGSVCPHIAQLGDYKEDQLYFMQKTKQSEGKTEWNYRYMPLKP